MPFEAIVNQHIWSKLVSVQYNLQSRLPHGTKIASNSILLLHVRQMFLSFMVSVKMDAMPGGRGTKPQNVGKFWLCITTFEMEVANSLAPKPFPIPMEIHFRECTSVDVPTNKVRFHCCPAGIRAMVNGLSCICG
jgi:hypothetical protein